MRIGVIGAGQAGERNALGFQAVADVDVVGVADTNSARANSLARAVGATSMHDWRDLFALGLDIVVVALPHSMHVEPAVIAAKYGAHVLMEKPIATTVDDGRRIVDVCGENGIKLAVSFVHRFRKESDLAKRWLTTLGQPQVARECMSSQRSAAHPTWLSSKLIAGGGVLMYSAIHGVDRLRWLIGAEVVEVAARTRRYSDPTEVEDGICALLTFENGAIATLNANAPKYRAQPTVWESEIHAERGMVRFRTRYFVEASSDLGTMRYDTADDPEVADPNYNFTRQAEDVVNAVRHDRPPTVDGTAGLRALEVCLAIYESANSGRVVAVRRID